MEGRDADAAVAAPAPQLQRLVGGYSGIRYEGFPPGTHLGLPSRRLTVVFSLGTPRLTPKQAPRVVRFERSWLLLRRLERARRQSHGDRPSLSEIAACCCYYDQAHLAREWNQLAGCPPSTWLAAEELPFVQDASAEAELASAA